MIEKNRFSAIQIVMLLCQIEVAVGQGSAKME